MWIYEHFPGMQSSSLESPFIPSDTIYLQLVLCVQIDGFTHVVMTIVQVTYLR